MWLFDKKYINLKTVCFTVLPITGVWENEQKKNYRIVWNGWFWNRLLVYQLEFCVDDGVAVGCAIVCSPGICCGCKKCAAYIAGAYAWNGAWYIACGWTEDWKFVGWICCGVWDWDVCGVYGNDTYTLKKIQFNQ